MPYSSPCVQAMTYSALTWTQGGMGGEYYFHSWLGHNLALTQMHTIQFEHIHGTKGNAAF